MTDVGGIAADALYHHGIPWLAKKTIEMGRYGASEIMRDKKLQKKAVDYGMKEKLWINYQPKYKKYITNRKDLDGSGVDIHKWIGKLPRPKAGWTPGNYKYMGAYNPLDKQLEYDPQTGEVFEMARYAL